jgi:hypothetical protein
MTRRILAAVAVMLLAGPGSQTVHAGAGDYQNPDAPAGAQEPRRNLEPGMTREQAIELIGKPVDVAVSTDSQGRKIEDWIYATGEWLRFIDGRLESVGMLEWLPRAPDTPDKVHSM